MGNLTLNGATSGQITLAPTAVAGTNTLTLPASTGTLVTSESATISGNLTFTGTGNRITGDFSNATVANRVAFQTSTVNGNSVVGVIPNGTAVVSALQVSNNSDLTAPLSFGNFQVDTSAVSLQSSIRNSGTYLPLTFLTSATERMRIDTSGNVGIGTNSPAKKLHVNGDIRLGDGGGTGAIFTDATNGLRFMLPAAGTSNTESMRLDSSGNLLVGASSVTGSVAPKLYVSGSAADGTQGVQIINYKPALVLSDISSGYYNYQIATDSGLLTFGYEAGTAGSTNTFTNRMVIDSSGNVGIGTSSPASKLHVAGSFRQTGATVPFEWTVNAGAADFYKLNAVGFADNLIVANSSGNVGIGTSSPSYKLDVNGATSASYLNFNANTAAAPGVDAAVTRPANGTLAFITNTAERARIDSSGNLLVGKTDTTFSTSGAKISSTSEFTASGTKAIAVNRTTSDGAVIEMFRGGTSVGTISVTSSATAYNTSSDYRLKNTVVPLTTGLSTISALKPVNYKWNVDDSNGEGFIAHELQSVIPLAVTGEKDAVDDEGNIKPQGVDYSKIVVHLVAAIQEQQSIISDIQSRIAALEAK